MLGEGADEIVEDGELRAAELIADDVGERGEIDRSAGFGICGFRSYRSPCRLLGGRHKMAYPPALT